MIRWRLVIIAVATAVLAGGLLRWRSSGARPGDSGATAAEGQGEGQRGRRGGGRPRPLPPPVFEAGTGDAAVPVIAGMSEGLATDLQKMDATQLRAELQSIVVSYPEVQLGAVDCARLPCSAEASSHDGQQMNAFAQMVSHRFQGHLRVRWRRSDAEGGLAVSFQIGTRERLAPEAALLPGDLR